MAVEFEILFRDESEDESLVDGKPIDADAPGAPVGGHNQPGIGKDDFRSLTFAITELARVVKGQPPEDQGIKPEDVGPPSRRLRESMDMAATTGGAPLVRQISELTQAVTALGRVVGFAERERKEEQPRAESPIIPSVRQPKQTETPRERVDRKVQETLDNAFSVFDEPTETKSVDAPAPKATVPTTPVPQAVEQPKAKPPSLRERVERVVSEKTQSLRERIIQAGRAVAQSPVVQPVVRAYQSVAGVTRPARQRVAQTVAAVTRPLRQRVEQVRNVVNETTRPARERIATVARAVIPRREEHKTERVDRSERDSSVTRQERTERINRRVQETLDKAFSESTTKTERIEQTRQPEQPRGIVRRAVDAVRGAGRAVAATVRPVVSRSEPAIPGTNRIETRTERIDRRVKETLDKAFERIIPADEKDDSQPVVDAINKQTKRREKSEGLLSRILGGIRQTRIGQFIAARAQGVRNVAGRAVGRVAGSGAGRAVLGGVARVATKIGIFGLAIGGTALAVAGFGLVVGAASRKFRTLADRIEDVSGPVAAVRARAQAAREIRNVEFAQRVGPQVARVEGARAQLGAAVGQLSDSLTETLVNIVDGPLTKVLEIGTVGVSAITAFKEAFDVWATLGLDEEEKKQAERAQKRLTDALNRLTGTISDDERGRVDEQIRQALAFNAPRPQQPAPVNPRLP